MPAPAAHPLQARESIASIFWQFLKLTLVGWGGPVARIALMHEEFVHRRRWISEKRFAKVLAVYQVLPGPEATELAVYFGHTRRGRWGGLLAGLGFVLPGFLLTLLVTWAYATYGLSLAPLAGVLYGIKPAVAALIALALVRLGKATVTGWTSGLIAVGAAGAFLLDLHFAAILGLGGLAAWLARRRGKAVLRLAAALPAAGAAAPLLALPTASWPLVFWTFLKAGLLTFGGAYTVVTFVYQEAVLRQGWLTAAQYLDGIALTQMLPAPVSIISTFAGYFAAGFPGAVLATLGLFLPAFLFTLAGYRHIMRLAESRKLRVVLDGVTAAVVGLLVATLLKLGRAAVTDIPSALIGIAALVLLWRRTNIAIVMLGAGGLGWLVQALA
jgi:chromate transporter